MSADARRYAPAAARNRDAILGVLRHHLPRSGLVLEVASGTGEHVLHFATASGPDFIFQPSDPDLNARASIDAWAAALASSNIRPAIALDVTSEGWPVAHADVVLCINMIHIAPWVATVGLMRGAAAVLPSGGMLSLYGPFRRDGRHTAPSNEAPPIEQYVLGRAGPRSGGCGGQDPRLRPALGRGDARQQPVSHLPALIMVLGRSASWRSTIQKTWRPCTREEVSSPKTRLLHMHEYVPNVFFTSERGSP